MIQTLLSFIAAHPFMALFGGVVAAIAVHHEWSFFIRPKLIPKAGIDAMVDELVEQHGCLADEIAFLEEDRASRYCLAYEQGKWRRVRQELLRRYPPAN